jgi:hypothetical protein
MRWLVMGICIQNCNLNFVEIDNLRFKARYFAPKTLWNPISFSFALESGCVGVKRHLVQNSNMPLLKISHPAASSRGPILNKTPPYTVENGHIARLWKGRLGANKPPLRCKIECEIAQQDQDDSEQNRAALLRTKDSSNVIEVRF